MQNAVEVNRASDFSRQAHGGRRFPAIRAPRM